jgi:poly-gamma-glutamate capsule biosynthesis protein CapA/YwtB (metallophosphatase superfamily)
MKHYLHISAYVSLDPIGYSVSDFMFEVENTTIGQIREMLKSSIEKDGVKCKNFPTIISIDELSEELYKMLKSDGRTESQNGGREDDSSPS